MKVLDGQSIFDVATQESGSIDSAFEIAMANGLSITEELTPGLSLTVPTIWDKDIAEYFNQKALKPATAITSADITQTIADEGVEFWAIEIDFVVS